MSVGAREEPGRWWIDSQRMYPRGDAMMIFGPVSVAAKGGQDSPWFGFFVAVGFLIYTWFQYFRAGRKKPVSLNIALAISATCVLGIVLDVWFVFHPR